MGVILRWCLQANHTWFPETNEPSPLTQNDPAYRRVVHNPRYVGLKLFSYVIVGPIHTPRLCVGEEQYNTIAWICQTPPDLWR